MADLLTLDALVPAIGWALIQFAWQGAAAGLLLAALLALLRRASPALRYVVACAGLSVMAALPVVQVVEHLGDPVVESPSPTGTWFASTETAAAAASGVAMPVPSIPEGEEVGWAEVVDAVAPWSVAIWIAGVSVMSLRLFGGWIVVTRLRFRGRRAVAPSVQERAIVLARRLGVRTAVRVVDSMAVMVPTVLGCVRPVILLPASALSGLSPVQLDAILAHELAHVRRFDYAVNLAQMVVETLLFYHPAVWWVSNRIRVEREHCCDDLAVRALGDRVEYVGALTALESLRSPAAPVLAATGGSLLERVRRLLHAPADVKTGASADGWLTACALMLLLALVGAVIVAFAGRLEANQNRPAPPAPAAPVVPPAPAAAPAPPAVPAVAALPVAPRPVRPLRAQREQTSSWSSGSGQVEIRLRGDVEFADDDRSVVRISPGGHLFVSEGWMLNRRRVELRGRRDGTVDRRFFTTFREVPYEPAGHDWLADRLPRLLRNSGIGAESRTANLLRRQGVDGVIREVSRIDSDHVRRIYLRELVRQAPMTPALLARVLQATSGIDSDFELAELLMHIAGTQRLEGEAVAAYFAAVDRFDSDFERRRVLSALNVTEEGPLLDGVLRSATLFDSDFEAAELLREIAFRAGVERSRDLFFQALRTLDSDFEHRRVLSAVLANSTTSDATLEAALQSAGAMDSDFEVASFLVALAASRPVEGALRQTYLTTAEGISSDFEQSRALATLVRSERRR